RMEAAYDSYDHESAASQPTGKMRPKPKTQAKTRPRIQTGPEKGNGRDAPATEPPSCNQVEMPQINQVTPKRFPIVNRRPAPLPLQELGAIERRLSSYRCQCLRIVQTRLPGVHKI